MTSQLVQIAALTLSLLLNSGIRTFHSSYPYFKSGTRLEMPKPPPLLFTNPVIDRDLPDPGVLIDYPANDRWRVQFWMTHTTGKVPGCPIWSSPDLVHWKFKTHALTPENTPSWVKNRLWAPELHKVDDLYILLFTAGNADGRLCIGAATAKSALGPYEVRKEPLIGDEVQGAIDPTLFQDTGIGGKKRVYLIWKTDGNATGQPCRLLAQQMDPKHPGTEFARGSHPVELMASHSQGWEGGIIEAPELAKVNGKYYLFYSGNGYASNYAEGVARSESLLGPYERCPNNPIMHGNKQWANPGHAMFFQDTAGNWWHQYHAYHRDKMEAGRVQMLDRVYFDASDGWPHIGLNGTPSSNAQPAPIVDSENHKSSRP